MQTDQILTVLLKTGLGLTVGFFIYILKDLASSVKAMKKEHTSSLTDLRKFAEQIVVSVNNLNVTIAHLIEKDMAKSQRLDFQDKQLLKLDIENSNLKENLVKNTTKIQSIEKTIYSKDK